MPLLKIIKLSDKQICLGSQNSLSFSMLERYLFSSVRRHHRQFLDLWNPLGFLSTASTLGKRGSLELEEVQKVLSDVKADDVRVIQVGDQCNWAEHIVIATGRSTWHVKNIAQALLHKAGLSSLFLSSSLEAGA